MLRRSLVSISVAGYLAVADLAGAGGFAKRKSL